MKPPLITYLRDLRVHVAPEGHEQLAALEERAEQLLELRVAARNIAARARWDRDRGVYCVDPADYDQLRVVLDSLHGMI